MFTKQDRELAVCGGLRSSSAGDCFSTKLHRSKFTKKIVLSILKISFKEIPFKTISLTEVLS